MIVWPVQNSFRISTDVDDTLAVELMIVQNSFRISTDVDAIVPLLKNEFQNSFKISTDVDTSVPTANARSKTHSEFLLM